MKTISLSIILVMLVHLSLSAQILLADNKTITPTEVTNEISENAKISLQLSVPETSQSIALDFQVKEKSRWLVQVADQDDIVLYHQTGYGKGQYELEIATSKFKSGKYQVVVWSNDSYVIREIYVDNQ